MGALVRTSVRHQDDQSVRSLGGWVRDRISSGRSPTWFGRALRGCGPVDPDSHNVAMLASGAAQESNLPTHGLHALADFEDRTDLAQRGRLSGVCAPGCAPWEGIRFSAVSNTPMVSRGSTLRVRQSALQERRTSAPSRSERLALDPAYGGYGGVYGDFALRRRHAEAYHSGGR
jgi:hypothetical protein